MVLRAAGTPAPPQLGARRLDIPDGRYLGIATFRSGRSRTWDTLARARSFRIDGSGSRDASDDPGRSITLFSSRRDVISIDTRQIGRGNDPPYETKRSVARWRTSEEG